MAYALGQPFDFDQKFLLPQNFIYAGTTQSGKTTLLQKTLENAAKMYNPVPTRVYLMYNSFQTSYVKMKQSLEAQGIECCLAKSSVLTEKDLDAMSDANGGQTLIIIDDNSVGVASSKEIAHLTTLCRHKNCSMILLLHFIFASYPSLRVISNNTSYFFLLKAPRMIQQVANLGSQISCRKALLHAYKQEMKTNYSHILVDLCPTTPEHMRIRSGVLDQHQKVYIPSL